ncbi:MAG: hypothetical protein ABJE10_02215 [bacterium]
MLDSPSLDDRPRLPGNSHESVTKHRSLTRIPDWRVILFALLALSAVYVSLHLDRGWYLVDDGALAHPAERVLQGELPHRDFDDVYTGGLAYLNAAAFRLFGTTLWSMRLVLFAVFLTWVPAVFYIASRFAGLLAAASMTLLCVAWSIPNYPAPMPSWYNLFLATFGVAALFRYLECRRRRWVVIAGVVGGFSVLVKVVGLYYVAGVLLFLIFQAHADAQARDGVRTRGVAYATFVSAALLLFVGALCVLVRHQLFGAEVVHFVVPGTLIAGLLVRNEWRVCSGTSRTRFLELARLLAPFIAGVALPVAIFLVPYARSHALAALFNGVFILPMRRLTGVSAHMRPLLTLLTLALPASVIAFGAVTTRRALRGRSVALLAVALALLVVATSSSAFLYRLVWDSARGLLPALVVIGVVVLSRHRTADAESSLLRSRTMLLLSVAALCSVVQFPFSAAIYFCYVAPLVALAALALFRYAPPMPATVSATLLAFYLSFAVFRINTSAQFGMGRFYLPAASIPFAAMTESRAGIEVPRVTSKEYQAVTYLLQTHARGGYTWASPDTPEMYFLTGLRNPTRSLYGIFDDSTEHTARILHALHVRGVTAIVENKEPFSPRLAPDLVRELELRYPHAAEIGPYLVRWQ